MRHRVGHLGRALLLLCFASTARGQSAGTEPNLSLGASGRVIALGGAALADLSDASAVYWNPAALARLGRSSIALMHAPIGFGDASQNFVAAAYPSLHAGTFGAGLMRLSSGGIQAYDATSAPQGELEYAETAFYLGYAAAPRLPFLGQQLGLGLTFKTLTQSLTPWSTTGTGLDLAATLAPATGRWRAALTLENALAPRLRLDQRDDLLPRVAHLAGTYRAGLGRDLDVALHAALEHQQYAGWGPQLGVECSYRERLQLRLGGSRHGVAFGFGLAWNAARFDYAFLSRTDAATQPVSLSSGFGQDVFERREALAAGLRAQGEAARHAELRAVVEARLTSAQQAYERGDWASAFDTWKLAAGLDSTEVRAQEGMQAAARKLAEATARSQHASELALSRAAEFQAGSRYYESGDYLLARDVWQKLLAQDPNHAEARRGLDRAQERLREQAVRHAEQAQQLESRHDWVSALGEWNRLRAQDAQNAEAQAGLLRCRAAIEAAEARPLPRPEPQPSRAAQAVARDEAERPARALSPQERAQVRELYLRGMTHFTASEFDQAITEWQKILRIDPRNESVQRNIDEARARLRALNH